MYIALNSLIAEPFDVINKNIDEIKLIMEGHKYSTLISRKILIVESQILMS
jgi:hypothetical protein